MTGSLRVSVSSRPTPTTRRPAPRSAGHGRRSKLLSDSWMSSIHKSSRLKRPSIRPSADRDLAQLNLGYTEIRSPIDGVVGNRSCAGRRLCDGRSPTAGHRSGAQSLGRCQFQGKPACAHARGPICRDRCRRAAGRRDSVAACEPRARHRRTVQRDPAGECDRQFHQNRSACAGAHPARWTTAPNWACCGLASR